MKILKGILKVIESITIIHLIVKVIELEKTQSRLVQLGKNDYEQLCAAEKDIERLENEINEVEEDVNSKTEEYYRLIANMHKMRTEVDRIYATRKRFDFSMVSDNFSKEDEA